MLDNTKEIKPNLKGEMDELERVSQDLSRDYGVDVSVEDLIKAFNKTKQQVLSSDIWAKLQNTESNEIDKGDFDSVKTIAKKYNKTNPATLVKSLKAGDYDRPLIVKFGNDEYHLVAGNTRLCTAAAMGMKPKVFIANIENMNENEKLKGGQSDNMSLNDMTTDSGEYKITLQQLKDQLKKGIKVEMEHTNDPKIAKEIAMDHISEDPAYYDKLEKIEATEMTGAVSAGAYSANAFGSPIKKPINKINNADLTEVESELGEATDASSSGSYDVPAFGKTPKGGRKNPLKIDGPGSEYKGRAVTDKNFPKWGGPDSKFVKINDKCKKYPYCNQGDMSALEMMETDEIKKAIQENAIKYGLPTKVVEKLVLNEIKQIFI